MHFQALQKSLAVLSQTINNVYEKILYCSGGGYTHVTKFICPALLKLLSEFCSDQCTVAGAGSMRAVFAVS